MKPSVDNEENKGRTDLKIKAKKEESSKKVRKFPVREKEKIFRNREKCGRKWVLFGKKGDASIGGISRSERACSRSTKQSRINAWRPSKF